MQVSLENTGELSRKLSITVPAADIDRMATERLEQISKTVKMPGFRPGKVPMDVVKRQHGDRVMGEITERVISESLAKAMQEKEVRPAGQPMMDQGAGLPEAGKDYSFSVTFDVYPEFKPAKVEGIKLTKDIAEPTDEMVEELLGRLAESRKSYKKKEGAAVKGDKVTINGEGFVKGEKEGFEGGNLKDFPIVLGSGSLIPGFEENLEGVKAGDKKDVEVEFPKDYHSKELAGKPAVFKCEVLRIEEAEEPKFDDKFATLFGEKTMGDLRQKVREQLETDLNNASEQRLKRALFDVIEKDNQFDLPASVVDAEFKAVWDAQMNDLKQRGMGIEALGKSEEDAKAEFRTLAERRVRLGLVLAELGKEHKIQVEKADIEAEIQSIADRNPGMEDQVKQFYADPQRQNEIVGPLFEKKVTDWVLSKAKVTENKVDTKELMKEFGQ
ncbi:MAG: trigger factor [Magnetococcales bacterium]|nr:trigger factor [Magnetococcales bacterium]|tara:strand:+ start:72290 stop:73615 length:1326 start_codon:yes stop_codon:yes gene_type:complete